MSAKDWIYVAAFVVAVAIVWVGVVAVTPKRHPGRHAPDATESRGEAGADVAYAAELAQLAEEIAEEPALVLPEPDEDDEHQAEPVDPEVEQPSPDDPSWWALPPAATEPTPIFRSAGQYPQMEELETFTHGWNRDEILRAVRAEEARQAGVRAA